MMRYFSIGQDASLCRKVFIASPLSRQSALSNWELCFSSQLQSQYGCLAGCMPHIIDKQDKDAIPNVDGRKRSMPQVTSFVKKQLCHCYCLQDVYHKLWNQQGLFAEEGTSRQNAQFLQTPRN